MRINLLPNKIFSKDVVVKKVKKISSFIKNKTDTFEKNVSETFQDTQKQKEESVHNIKDKISCIGKRLKRELWDVFDGIV